MTWTSLSSFGMNPGFSCFPNGAVSGGSSPPSPQSARVHLNQTMQVTLWTTHSLSGGVFSYGLAGDCTAPAPACLMNATYPDVVTMQVDAGFYELQSFRFGGTSAIFEPLAPPATNTSCGAAIVVTSTPQTQPRVRDGLARYFIYSAPSTQMVSISITSTMTAGHVSAVVRTNCTDAGTDIAGGQLPFVLGNTTFGRFQAQANATYWIVVSDISPGLEFSIAVVP